MSIEAIVSEHIPVPLIRQSFWKELAPVLENSSSDAAGAAVARYALSQMNDDSDRINISAAKEDTPNAVVMKYIPDPVARLSFWKALAPVLRNVVAEAAGAAVAKYALDQVYDKGEMASKESIPMPEGRRYMPC